MPASQKMIQETDINNLVILDACRYDVFKKVFKKYISGRLKRLVSPDSWTGGWFEKNFQKFRLKDTIYISVNPFINSKGLNTSTRNYDASVSKNFHKVIEAWNLVWNEENKTVRPKDLGNSGEEIELRILQLKL